MKRLAVLTGLCVVLASQAAALSCLKPNIGRTFNFVQESADTFSMALGTVTAKGRIPKYVEGKPRYIPSKFKGVFLGSNGQSKEHEIDITVDAICVVHWCGGFPETDEDMLVFLKKTDVGYRLESNPCGGNYKIAPTPKEVRTLQKCMRRGKCSNWQIKSLGPEF